MKRYEIVFGRDVEKLYRRLPKDLISRLDRAILALADDHPKLPLDICV